MLTRIGSLSYVGGQDDKILLLPLEIPAAKFVQIIRAIAVCRHVLCILSEIAQK